MATHAIDTWSSELFIVIVVKIGWCGNVVTWLLAGLCFSAKLLSCNIEAHVEHFQKLYRPSLKFRKRETLE